VNATSAARVPSAHLDVLDGFRGLAILHVVLFHAWLVTGFPLSVQVAGRTIGLQFLAETGYLGVDLFFFISGFCLYYPFARATFEGTREPTWTHFAYRRVVKIVPGYLLALAVFTLAYRGRFGSPEEEALHVLAHLFFVHVFDPETFASISGPLWTIGVEVQFYAIFPLLCVVFRARPRATYLGVVAFACAYRFTLGATGNATSFSLINQLPAVADVFVAGVFGAHLVVAARTHHALRLLERRDALALGAAALLAAGIATLGLVDGWTGADADRIHVALNAYRVVVGPFLLVTIVACIFAAPARGAVPAPLRGLSTISYALYLWNLETMVRLADAHLPQPLAYALGILLSIALAAATTYAIERPILAYDWRPPLRRLLRKRDDTIKVLRSDGLDGEPRSAREQHHAGELRSAPELRE